MKQGWLIVNGFLESPKFGLTWDVGHSKAVKEQDVPFLLAHEARLAHFHIHDATETPPRNHLALGDGEIDIKERLRLGTPALINRLQEMGCEVWVYTSSYRSERYIRRLFRLYGVKFDGIVNAQRHLKEVQGGRSAILPQKVPSRYRISLHVDDESVICTSAGQYGFEAYELNAQDDDWQEKIVRRTEQIRKRKGFV